MKKFFYVIATMALTVMLVDPVAADKTFSVRDVKGRYTFSFQGEIPGVAVLAATGLIQADGRGNVTQGVRMISINGVASTEMFTCTLVVHPNGTGSAVCPPDNNPDAVETYNFVLRDGGKSFSFIATTLGVVVLGDGVRQ